MAKVVVKLQIAEYAARVKNAANVGMNAAAETIANQARVNLSRVGKFKSFARQASKADKRFVKQYGFVDPPGGMPRLRTGHLRRSITWDAPNAAGMLRRRIGVGHDMKYGRIHELGGVAGRAHIPARPYLRPALVIAGAAASAKFSSIVRGALRNVKVMK